MWCTFLPPHRRSLRRCCLAVLLSLLLCVVQGPRVVHAWPRILSFTRSSGTERTAAPAGSGGAQRNAQQERSAFHHPPLPFPGAAERVEQARALWQEVEARGRLSPCWKRSLLLLQAQCGDVQRDEATRSRLALFMATCDADNDGRVHPSFHCGSDSAAMPSESVRACVRSLSDTAYAAFVQYRLHADVLCAYLQEELYQERTEAAVAAMVQQVESSAAVLAALQDAGAEMFALTRDTQALQREAQTATVGLRQQLDHLHEGHSATLSALRTAADDILDTSTRTDATLGQLHAHVQAAAAEALASVEALSHQSLQQLAAMEEQTRGVVQLMEQVDRVQQLLSRRTVSWQRLLFALLCVAAVFIATSAPRTAAARLPAIIVTVLGVAGGPLVGRWAGQPTSGLAALLLRTGLWHYAAATSVLCLVCGSAYRYVPPELWHRQVVREEARRLWNELHTHGVATSALQPYLPRSPQPPPPSSLPHCLPLFFKPPRVQVVQRSVEITDALPRDVVTYPLSIAATPPGSDTDEAPRSPAAYSPEHSPNAAATVCDVATPPAAASATITPRKRGRPAVAAAASGDAADEKSDAAQVSKTARVEAPSRASKAPPLKPRGGRRASTKSPKKKG